MCVCVLSFHQTFSVHGNKSLGDSHQGGVGSAVAEAFLCHSLADATDSTFCAIQLAAGIWWTHTHTHLHSPYSFMSDAAISLSDRNSDTKLARQPERLHQLMMCTSVVINRPLLDVINNDHVVVALISMSKLQPVEWRWIKVVFWQYQHQF